MKDIVDYSEKVKEETSTKIKNEEESLKKSLIPDEYKIVYDTEANSINRKRILKQNKRKKFHHLKYHRTSFPHNSISPTNESEKQGNRNTQNRNNNGPTYANRHYQETNMTPDRDTRNRYDNWLTLTNHGYQEQPKLWSSVVKTSSKTNTQTTETITTAMIHINSKMKNKFRTYVIRSQH